MTKLGKNLCFLAQHTTNEREEEEEEKREKMNGSQKS